jgi:hypothetical protein
MAGKTMKNKHNYLRILLLCGLTFYLCLCLSMRITLRDTALTEGDCQLYYIVNADGMKGLGHSILMLVDADGAGTVFSFNGMQYSLGESLLGKAGVGKMSTGTMDAEEVSRFLQTGNLELDEDQLTDNYDWALYRNITESDMECILESTKPYIQAEQDFAALYLLWAQTTDKAEREKLDEELEAMSRDASLPLYRIYTNNCDHAARLLAASADRDMQTYSMHTWHMTPNGNLKAFSRRAPKWGAMELGENSVFENLLAFLMIF